MWGMPYLRQHCKRTHLTPSEVTGGAEERGEGQITKTLGGSCLGLMNHVPEQMASSGLLYERLLWLQCGVSIGRSSKETESNLRGLDVQPLQMHRRTENRDRRTCVRQPTRLAGVGGLREGYLSDGAGVQMVLLAGLEHSLRVGYDLINTVHCFTVRVQSASTCL